MLAQRVLNGRWDTIAQKHNTLSWRTRYILMTAVIVLWPIILVITLILMGFAWLWNRRNRV
jgi:hypothetical protein